MNRKNLTIVITNFFNSKIREVGLQFYEGNFSKVIVIL